MLVRSPATRSVRGPGQLGSRSVRAWTWPDVVVVLGLVVPATFVPLAAAGGGGDIVVPYQHFYIVSAAVIGENPRLFGFNFDNPLASLQQ